VEKTPLRRPWIPLGNSATIAKQNGSGYFWGYNTPGIGSADFAYIYKSDGSYTKFDNYTIGGVLGTSGTYNMLVSYVNANGWAIGETSFGDGAYSILYGPDVGKEGLWNGTTAVALDGDPFTCSYSLNDNGYVLASDGWVLTGTQTPITNLVPKAFRGQISQINPLLLSNADTTNNNAYNIVFNALSREGSGTGQQVPTTFLLNVSGTNTTLNTMILPPGITLDNLVSINKSGIIAAIGDPNNTGKQHALLLLPVQFYVQTIANDAHPNFVFSGDLDQYLVNAWIFNANVRMPNIPGISNQIKCGVLRDMKFECTKNVIGSAPVDDDVKSINDTPQTRNGFLPDLPCDPSTVGVAPLPPYILPLLPSEASFMMSGSLSSNYYLWNPLDSDEPALSVSPSQKPYTTSVRDIVQSRYYFYVQFGNSKPSPVSEVDVSYNNYFTAQQDPVTGKTITLQQQKSRGTSYVYPPVGTAVYGGTIINPPVIHTVPSNSEAVSYISRLWR